MIFGCILGFLASSNNLCVCGEGRGDEAFWVFFGIFQQIPITCVFFGFFQQVLVAHVCFLGVFGGFQQALITSVCFFGFF